MAESEKGKRQRDLPSGGSLPKWLTKLKAMSFFQVSYMGSEAQGFGLFSATFAGF